MSLYTGSSNDPDNRFINHKSGKGAKYTRSHMPLKRVYLELFNSKSGALKREREIKGWSRAKKIQLLKLKI